MIRILALFLVLIMGLPANARQDLKPILRTEFEVNQAVPGQPLILRVTILVPTWMPKPPVYPGFEVVNAITRLPSRASSPTSLPIDGETWSGIVRSYRIYPMMAGRFEIPAQTIQVTYADPVTRDPVVENLQTDAVVFEGVVPEGGKGLSPFIAATELSLIQSIEGTPENMKPGDAVVRTIAATVKGVSPIFLPPFLSDDGETGLSVYPKEPVVVESENRGILSGSRVESVTYVAASGGRFELPPINLDWFDLGANQVENITVEGLDILVRGDPAPAVEEPFDWQKASIMAAVTLAGLTVLWLLAQRFGPNIRTSLTRLQGRRRASEANAYKLAEAAFEARDLNLATITSSSWLQQVVLEGVAIDRAGLSASLSSIGRLSYGDSGNLTDAATAKLQWRRALQTLRGLRKTYLEQKKQKADGRVLPPLNPGKVA